MYHTCWSVSPLETSDLILCQALPVRDAIFKP